MNIIFHIEGGLGKTVMATAVLKAIKKKWPKSYIIVVTAYPDVFIGNPNASKVFTNGQLNSLYKNYIMDKECKVFAIDPYSTDKFIQGKDHLISIWCELCETTYDGELPEFFISKAEKQYFEPLYRLDKPIMSIQPNGGNPTQNLMYSWTRDIPAPIMQDIIDYFKDDYSIIHIKRPDQISYANTLGAIDDYRSIAILLQLSKKRLLIDSSAMHIATALNLPSVVAWITTSPKVLGYEIHNNILSNPPKKEIDLDHPFYTKHQFFEPLSTLPYNDLNEIFDKNKIIKALK